MAKRSWKHFFSHNPTVNTQRTLFDMGYTDTVTLNPDYYYPNFKQLILPGDTIVIDYSNMIRMLDPLQVPMMDNLYCDTHFWFIPFDNVWDYTEQFFGEPRRPSDPVISSLPKINFTSSTLPQVNSVYDYFGIPIQGTDSLLSGGFSIQALPLLSYYAIHDDWIRDEQRQNYLLDTPDFSAQTFAPSKFALYKRGKRFDYFTSTLLNPQIGTPTTLPLGTTAPVVGDGKTIGITNGTTNYGFVNSSNSGLLAQTTGFNTTPGTVTSGTNASNLQAFGLVQDGTKSGIVADLSNASAISVEVLRRAFQVQAYNELMARYGTRYPEYLYSMYGVVSDDLLLRRCEYLGGTHQRLSVQPIVQNSSSTSTQPLGDLGAIVSGGTSESICTRSFTKFGYIIGCINIYADLTYYQGLDKEWSLTDKMDFPVNVFANLTDQPVYKKELVLTGTSSDDDVFGYQEIYAWAKYNKNTLRGYVRPNAPTTVGYWSLAQQFASVPVNDGTFIESNTPITNITAVSGGNNAVHFICNQKFDVKLTRELPAHSDPMKWFTRG